MTVAKHAPGRELLRREVAQFAFKPGARGPFRLVALDPERVIFAHGRWFERNGAAQLRRSFGWLLR